MKAITTYRLPCTYTKPSRIVACDMDGNKVTITHPGGIGVMPHALAARYLCAKMRWTGTLCAGATAKGYVFTWVDKDTVMRVSGDGHSTLPAEAM